MLVAQNLKPTSVQSYLATVCSFFSAHRLKLSFKRGELKVTTRLEDKVVTEWIPTNEQARQIYQQGDARDRALFLVLYQSGFSETDVSSLNIEQLPNIQTHEGHYFIALHREKTDILQRTCLSEEAVHDIKAMLRERGNPTKDALFISQKGKRLDTRFINDTIKTMVAKAYGEEKAKEFKTKSLRDSYNDALLRANLTQEVKDTLFGHKRSGAKEKYAISPTTVIDAYTQAFKFLTVNHGTQARKDIEKVNVALDVLTEKLAKQDAKIKETLDNLSGIEEAIHHLQKKHPEITQQEFDELKKTFEVTTERLSQKIDKITAHLKLDKSEA